MKGLPGLAGLPDLPGPKSPRIANPSILDMIQAALTNRQPLTATYDKKHRELSPIALGLWDGEHRLWVYQFGGESSYVCKCFVVAKMSDTDITFGEWQSPETDPGPADCMKVVLQRIGEPAP